MYTEKDRDMLIAYAKLHFSHLIPRNSSDYNKQLQMLAENYADFEINGNNKS